MHRESATWTKTHQASPAPHRLLAADPSLDVEAPALVVEQKRCLSEARRRLMASPYSALHSVACTFHEGVLVLHGHVASYYLKQLAQASVGHIVGVDEVSNRVEVGKLDLLPVKYSKPRTGSANTNEEEEEKEEEARSTEE